MLKLTKTGIGLLTRQYRSVLHKCFLINVGLFALGAATMMVPSEAESAIIQDKVMEPEDILQYFGTEEGDKIRGTSGHLYWDNGLSDSGSSFSYDTDTHTAGGYVFFNIFNTDFATTKYANYTYTKPDNYTETSVPLSSEFNTPEYAELNDYGVLDSSSVNNKLFYNTHIGDDASSIYDTNHKSAIYNTKNNANLNIVADFIENSEVSEGDARGGAIYNTGSLGNITGDFIGNSVLGLDYEDEFEDGTKYAALSDARGGAIYNEGTIGKIVGDFIGNTASNTGVIIEPTGWKYGSAFGGAIYNTGTIASITGNFLRNGAYVGTAAYGNKASIYNEGTISLLADTQDIVFYGNGADLSQGLGAVTNLNAKTGKSIVFNGAISGSTSTTNDEENSVLNLNADNTNYGGEYIFNNTIYGGTINLGSAATASHSVTMRLGAMKQSNSGVTYGTLGEYSAPVLVNYAANSLLDTQNNNIDSNKLKKLQLNNTLNLNIDADLINPGVDTISSEAVSAAVNSLIIKDINVGGLDEEINIQLTDNDALKSVYKLDENYTVSGTLGAVVESVSYNNETGMLTFKTGGNGGGNQGRIHGLVEDNGNGTYTYHSTDMGDFVKPFANLAIGTTVEEDFLSLNSAIGGWNAGDANGKRTVNGTTRTRSSHLVNKQLSTEDGANNITTDTTSVGANLVRLDQAILNVEDNLDTDYYTKLESGEKKQESPLDLVQIVKGPTDSKSSVQGASAADARIGRAPDGLYDNLIKKAEDPLTRSAIASARDDIILFAAANDNNLTTFKQAI